MERELLLLGLLRREEMHGYRLHDFIERYMAACVDLKKSTAYYLLDKLANEGYVAASEERAGNRPRRTIYRLTAAGERQFQALLRQNLAGYLPARFAGMVGLAFLDEVEPAEALDLLSQRRAALADELAAARSTPTHPGSRQYVVDHQVAHLTAELAWLDQVIARREAAS